MPGGHSLFCSLWRSSGLGKGAPVRVPPAGGPRPTRPSGLRADTLPTLCGGGAAARPVQPPAGSGRGNVAAKAAPVGASWSSWPPAVARATRARRKAKPASGPLRGPCPGHSPRSVAAQVLRGGPAPTSGGFGAVRPSGPVGGASASLASPATPAAQAVPRGSAYALAARRSGAAALAASSGQAGPRPAACGLAPAGARNLCRRAHWRRKRRLLAHSRAAGRGERRLRAGVPAVAPAGKAKASPAQGGKPPTSGGLACQCPGQRWANVAGVPPSGGSPALFSFWGLGGAYRVVCCCLSCVWLRSCLVAGLSSWWCLWLGAVPACPVALALCTGGGFCLSAGGGVPWAFLACWCFCRSAGGCSVRVTAPLWVLSLAGGGPALGAVPCR